MNQKIKNFQNTNKFSKPKIKKSFNILSICIGDSINLKKLQENFKKYPYITREHPVILKLGLDQYVVITKFGVITFWNVTKNLRKEFINEIQNFVDGFDNSFSFFDYLKVFIINNKEDKVLFNKIILSKLDKEKIQIISFVLSQSVALERYEVKIEQRLNELAKIIENIKLNLKKEFKEQYLLSQISDIFLIKQKAISHLSLFDKPDTTWEKPEIEKLYNKLYLYFELEDRFDILNEKIEFLSENNKILLDFVSTQRSHFLEMIIIFLFALDIILIVIEFLFLK
jgi:uncharacterized Rmd1/YagE family protein